MPQPTGRNGAVQARLQATCHSRFNVDNLYRLQPLGETAIYNFWLHTKSVDITYLPCLSCAALCSCIAALTLIEHYWRWVSGFPTFTCGQVSGWCCTTSCQQLSQSAHLSCGPLLAWPCTGRSHCHGPWSLDTKRVSEWLWRSLEFATRTKIPSFFFQLGSLEVRNVWMPSLLSWWKRWETDAKVHTFCSARMAPWLRSTTARVVPPARLQGVFG